MSVRSGQVPQVWGFFSVTVFRRNMRTGLVETQVFKFYLGFSILNKISSRQKKNPGHFYWFTLKSFLLKSFLIMEITPNFRPALQGAMQKLDIPEF